MATPGRRGLVSSGTRQFSLAGKARCKPKQFYFAILVLHDLLVTSLRIIRNSPGSEVHLAV
jgi:hypothetical protein